MHFCLPKLCRGGESDSVRDTKLPSLSFKKTAMNSPTGSYGTNSLSRSPGSNCAYSEAIVWSLDDNPNWTLHRDYQKLQNEKNALIEKNIELESQQVELLSVIKFDQDQTAELNNQLKTVTCDLNNALSRKPKSKVGHQACFIPFERIFDLRWKSKSNNLQDRHSIVESNCDLLEAKLQFDLDNCRAERDQAREMLNVERKCKLRDYQGGHGESLFALEIKASALLHRARIMSKSREETRSKIQKRVTFLMENASE